MGIAEFIINGFKAAGKRLKVDGTTGGVYVDGDLVGGASLNTESYNGKPLKVELHVISGVLENLEVVGHARIAESVVVQGNVDAGMDVNCGDVRGKVHAGMGVTCGAVGGSVEAGMDVKCGNVTGNVDAGMGVKMRKD